MRLFLPFAAIVAALFLALPAQADSLLMPAKLYPSNATIKTYPTFTNDAYDLNWGTTGAGDPGFHTVSADTLGRVSGWAQTGVVKVPEHGQDYVAFNNVYSTSDAASAALADFAQSVETNFGGKPQTSHIMIGSETATVLRMQNKRWTAKFMGFTLGTTEVEIGVQYRTGHGDGSVAWSYIKQQAASLGQQSPSS